MARNLRTERGSESLGKARACVWQQHALQGRAGAFYDGIFSGGRVRMPAMAVVVNLGVIR